MTRNILIALIPLLMFGCSEDKNPVGQANGFITGKVTIDGSEMAGVTITVSAFSMTGGGTGKAGSFAHLASTTSDGDYSIEVFPGLYKIEFSFQQGFGYLHTARYPINVASGQETVVNVDLKDPRPSSLLARDGDGYVILTFEAGYNVDSYRVYRAVSGAGDFEMIDEFYNSSGYTISFYDSPPSVGSYIYRVTAIDNDVETEPSNEAEVDFTAIIGAPSGFRAIDQITHVALSWDEKYVASYYRIYRAVSSMENWVVLDSTSESAYNDVPEVYADYYYRVTCVSPYGTESEPSPGILVVYDGRYDPPSGLTLIDRGSNIYLTWIDENTEGYFNIYRSNEPNIDYIKIDSTFLGHYEDMPLVHDHYYYRITVVGANGMESEQSDSVGTLFDGRLDAPDPVQAEDLGLSVKISWSEILWGGAYIVYRSDDSQTYHQIARVSASYLYYYDQPPQAGTYYYKVSTETVDGVEGSLSEAVGIYFTDNLTAPENVEAENFGTFVTIAWNGTQNATGYKIYRSESSTGGYVEIGTSAYTNYTDAPQLPRAYYYKVRAIDNLGHESPFSFYAYVYYTDTPLPPHNVIAFDQLHKVLVQWQSYGDNYDYIVYRAVEPTGEYYPVDTTAYNSITDWPSAAGHYYFKVQSIAGPGQVSELSDDAHVYFSGILETPGNLQADTVGGYVSLTWNAVQGAAEYDVYRGTSEIEFDLIQTVYSPECTDAPSAGDTYYYAVTAKTEGGLESPRSAPVIVVYEP